LSTGKKKIKIELEDDEGGKYNLSLEGNLSKDKIQKVLNLVESLNISKDESNTSVKTDHGQTNNIIKNMNDINNQPLNSIESRIWTLVQNNFAFSSFTSSNVAESYESNYGEQLQLSLVSTYLSRYYDKNKLTRTKRGKEWIYKLIRTNKNLESELISQDVRSTSLTSPASRLVNSQYSPEHQDDDTFLKQNVLSTVYDLRL
jgi:predicted transcriptional regulator